MNNTKYVDSRDYDFYNENEYPLIDCEFLKKTLSKDFSKTQLASMLSEVVCCLQNNTKLSSKKKLEKIGTEILVDIFESLS